MSRRHPASNPGVAGALPAIIAVALRLAEIVHTVPSQMVNERLSPPLEFACQH
jgi:hypothetical protein